VAFFGQLIKKGIFTSMDHLLTDQYRLDIKKAVEHFWKTRGIQKNSKEKKPLWTLS
jgi:hypothetical protein